MNNNVEKSMIESLTKSNFAELGIDVGEALIDNLVANDLLKSIPIVNSILNVSKGIYQIRDAIFVKKIIRFLYQIEQISLSDREQFIKNELNSTSKQVKVGTKLIEILDRLDDSYKSDYIGKAFKLYIMGEIIFDEFVRASMIINRVQIDDFHHLYNFVERKNNNWDIPWLALVELESVGLIRRVSHNNVDELKDYQMYQTKFFTLSPLGKYILELEIV